MINFGSNPPFKGLEKTKTCHGELDSGIDPEHQVNSPHGNNRSNCQSMRHIEIQYSSILVKEAKKPGRERTPKSFAASDGRHSSHERTSAAPSHAQLPVRRNLVGNGAPAAQTHSTILRQGGEASVRDQRVLLWTMISPLPITRTVFPRNRYLVLIFSE
jgi:hypothetical protein